MHKPLQVAIADDHPMVREGTIAALSGQPDISVSGIAEDGHAALRLLESNPPDVLLLDLQLPGLSGTEVARRARRLAHDVAIVVLTAHDTPAYARALADLGVRGFISKEASAGEILAAIRAVAEGGTAFWSDAARQVFDQAGRSPLSMREQQVLAYLADGLSNAEIATSLDLSQRTVEAHVSRILEKLGARSRREAAQLVREGSVLITRGAS